jgi:hypothetical protein
MAVHRQTFSVHETVQAIPDITYDRRWGGWGSNPRPAHYEETGLSAVGAGWEPLLSIGAGQPGSGGMGRDRSGWGGMGRMFPFCSHREAGHGSLACTGRHYRRLSP